MYGVLGKSFLAGLFRLAKIISSIVGPAIGGALAQPCDNYPAFFARGTLFDRFPFLLPNLVCAAILAVGVTIGILFLEETHAGKKQKRDVGLEVGSWILRRKRREELPDTYTKPEDANVEESTSLLDDDKPAGYRTTEGTPCQQSSRAQSPAATARMALDIRVKEGLERKPQGAHKAFTKQVIMNIAAYGILA